MSWSAATPRSRMLKAATRFVVSCVRAMSIVYFTLVAIVLYFGADWILERVEVAAGRRFEHRSLIFFAILLTLSLSSFSLIQHYTGSS